MRRFRDFINSFYLLDLPNRFAGLEGIRGLSVLMVFFFHIAGGQYDSDYFAAKYSPLWHFFRMLNGGHIGVDIFFMLSGFLIAYTTKSGVFDFMSFMRKRFARLMPAHAFVLTAFVLIETKLLVFTPVVLVGALLYNRALWQKQYGRLLKNILASAAVIYMLILGSLAIGGVFNGKFAGDVTRSFFGGNFIANFFPMQFFFLAIDSISTVTWTLCAEFAFYFSFAVIAIGLGAGRSSWRFPVLAALAAVLYLFNAPISKTLTTAGMAPVPIDRFMAFIFGIGLAKLYIRNLLPARAFEKVSIISLLALPLIQYSWSFFSKFSQPNPFYLIVDIAVFSILAALLAGRGVCTSVFARPLFRVFGSISYSFYLVHAMVMKWAFNLCTPYDLASTVVHMLISFCIAFTCSSIIYYYLERPYMCKPRPMALETACE